MSIEGILISLILFSIVGLWIVFPFIRRESRQSLIPHHHTSSKTLALAYYERILTNIHDLDEDYQTGKIESDVYIIEREAWVQRGIDLLQYIEQLEKDDAITTDINQVSLDEILEQKIQDYRDSMLTKA